MKKNRLAAGVLALAVSITACGCGEQVYELTSEEEALIVHYSAHIVTKFNKRQPEGIKDVAALKAQMEQEEKEAKEQEEEQQKQQEEEKQQSAETQTNTASENSSQQQEDTASYVSLSKALKLNGIKATYRKHEIVSSYHASSSYMVRANSGNELLVLYVNLKNSGNKTAECDILSKMPSFRLTINDELSVSADTTILLNDLGTYQDSIRAGDKARTVLIFQIQEGAVKTVNSMDLEVTIDGSSSLVKLAG